MRQQFILPLVCAALFSCGLAAAHAQASDKDLFAGFCAGVVKEALGELGKPGNEPSALQATNTFQRYRDYLIARGYMPSGIVSPIAINGALLAIRRGEAASRACQADLDRCLDAAKPPLGREFEIACPADMHFPACDQTQKCWDPKNIPF